MKHEHEWERLGERSRLLRCMSSLQRRLYDFYECVVPGCRHVTAVRKGEEPKP